MPNKRWVVRALHRGEHLDEVDAAAEQQVVADISYSSA